MVYFCIHKCPPLAHIPSHFNPVHAPSHCLKIHFSIILLSTPRCSNLPLSLTFPHRKPLVPSTCHMHYPSHSSWLDYPSNIWWAVQMIKLLIKQSSPVSRYFLLFGSTYLPQHPILEHLQLTFIPQIARPSFTLIQISREIYSTYAS